MKLRVEYAWKPPLCTHCRVFGHDFKNCNVRQRTEEERNEKVNYKKQDVSNDGVDSLKANGGWQSVRRPIRNVASTSKNIGLQFVNGTDDGNKGGNYGRGRGGMYGRGGLNGGRGGLSGGRGGMYQRGNNGVLGAKFVPVRNTGKQIDNVHIMDDNVDSSSGDKSKITNNAKSGNMKKVIERDEIHVENSFSALNDEIFEIGGEEWVQAKSKIDLAVELGMQIEDNEKKRWSYDLVKYYADKCDVQVKVNMIAGLRWRIAKLQKDIVHRNTCVSRVANEEAEKRCVALMKKEGITRTQAFGKIYEETYREELIKINSLQIEKQKAEVELFFYSEEVLTEEIRNDWTDEMVMQYEGLMGEKVNKIMNESLQGSQMECMDDEVAEDMSGTAKFMARNEVSDVVDGNDAEMQETQLRKKVVNNVCNEVFGAWDWVSNSVDSKKGCRIAVGWDPAVFRPMLISQTSQVMHFLVKRNMDNKEIYVSFVYGEINAMGRRELWKNLKDFNNIAGNFPWVLLGDFNVILSYNENSRGIRINNMGVYEFRDCVEFLNIEDVKITGLFFTWIQKRRDPNNGILKKLDRVMGNGKFVDAYVNAFANFLPFGVSDHSPAVLVFPEVKSRKNRAFRFLNYLTEKKEFITIVRDNWNVNVKGYAMFILAKRLKFLKKHMRDLNKRNGDVCEKVKSLKIELDRIQEALSNDPSSVHLREDELVFAEAYRRAVSDEELLLKQKSKIQWLKEGDFNSAYFHNMVKGRVIKSRIESVYDEDGNMFHNDDMAAKFVDHFKKFFGKCDVVYPIEDHENLFTKKLDPETAEELVKPVSDDEIKMALFDIEDNKASGPDGYTSKFFKSAWSVVGKDTCSAVKEFFSSGKLLGEFNASIISLIPKVVVPKKVIDYRPISCKLVSASVLRRGLDDFCLCSGLLPSMSKSEAFFGNVSSSVKADIGLVMPFKEGVLPIKYLGVPMVSKRITDKDFKIGNGRDCNIWFDKWHPRGPLSRLINHRILECADMSLKLSVNDMIEGNEWVWPIEWDDRFKEVTNVPVPILRPDVEDKTVWIDKRGKEKRFSVREVWKAIRIDCPKVIWYRHVWFSQCIPRHAFILWVAIKGKLKTLDRISRWVNTQSMERNCRCFVKKFRDVDCLYKIVVDMIRMKLMGLTLKCNSNVLEAASIWNLKMHSCRDLLLKWMANKSRMDSQLEGKPSSISSIACRVGMLFLDLGYGDGSVGVWLVPGFSDDLEFPFSPPVWRLLTLYVMAFLCNLSLGSVQCHLFFVA
ncbi:RNA-directed DNA polymerase, eukaryota, reverse transcriptase zinc-binding domain protein [Tanacetum coccineum]|uniref:RNA-directed DNA polymerase, eukaryota, reverse transcriptase zinc-binding domain protein n=1 Tax=Tanacetum coccineum TaxID=301880 RepID=A0ABQ5BGH1_9ASTR